MVNKIFNWLRLHLPTRIKTRYRGWKLTITQFGVIGNKADGSEHFIIGRLTSIEQAMRLGKNKVNRLEGPEVWNLYYRDEALK